MGHNSELCDFLGQIRQGVEEAKDSKDLQKVFGKLREYTQDGSRLEFQNTGKWTFATIFFIVSVFFGYFYFNSWELREYLGNYAFVIGVILGAGIIFPMTFAIANSSKISEISDVIFEKDILFDNRLVEIDVDGDEESFYEDYRSRFGDFRNRGDEGYEITRVIEGSMQAEKNKLAYRYYNFHYVRVYYVPVTTTDGKTTVTTMQRRTEDLYRYGLIIDFGLTKNIAVVSSGGSYDYSDSWKTSSGEFNKIFDVRTNDKQVVAKFLKPAVVLAFIELAKHLDGLNVEINGVGEMNISFEDDIAFNLERKYSIVEVDEFEKEVNAHRHLTEMEKIVEFVNVIYRHNDNNFA